VLRLTAAGGRTVLLTGDVEKEAQQALMDLGVPLTADVLKVPHHGSSHQLPEFLRAVHPRLTVTSVGAGNPFGHPSPATIGQLVREGRFRPDLYFRINTIQLVIPPLRERPEDIPHLARHLLDRMGPAGRVELTARAVEALRAYEWPGNVRELRNVLERALLLVGGATQLDRSDLRFERSPIRSSPDLFGDDVLSLAEMERQYIEHVLQRAGGAVDRAAAWLGIARSTLYQKLRRYRDSA